MSSNSTYAAYLTPSPIERNTISSVVLLLSALGVFSNLIVVILIYKNASLRKNCKYLQAALAVGDGVSCFGQLTNMIVTLIVNNLAPKLLRWHCLVLSTLGAMAAIYAIIMTIFIAGDRFVAITFPVKYRVMPKLRVCLYCVGVALLISLGFAVATYTDVNLFDYPVGCIGQGSRSPTMTSMFNNMIASAGICVAIIYPVTLIIIVVKTRRHLKSNSINQNSSTNKSFMKQVEITTSITCVVVVGIFTYVVPNLLLTILKALNSSNPLIVLVINRAPSYVGLGATLHSGINVVFYLWKDKTMRDAFKKLVRGMLKKTTTVISIL